MPDTQPIFRRTRFVCVSDTHNATSKGSFSLPAGDVLIHAGDLTNQGSYSELEKTVKWIEEADFEAKIVIAGNHDITLDTDFYTQYGLYFHNQSPQDPEKCQALLDNSPSILWLKNESATIDLVSPAGPRTTFKIFGSPLSPANGMWAFGYEPEEAAHIWNKIPLDTDIVVTHTPPKYHCDERKDRRSVGCEALRNTLWRVRPMLAICGHVHEGRGVERVSWDLTASNIKYKEERLDRWQDPGQGNKKLSLVDLSSRGGNKIRNDGAVGTVNDNDINAISTTSMNPVPTIQPMGPSNISIKSKTYTTDIGLSAIASALLALPPDTLEPANRGQGGIPPSQRCDLEALSGRLGRQETCIVNAAIMATSWPHTSGKKYNKPIVIDLDLPIWDK